MGRHFRAYCVLLSLLVLNSHMCAIASNIQRHTVSRRLRAHESSGSARGGAPDALMQVGAGTIEKATVEPLLVATLAIATAFKVGSIGTKFYRKYRNDQLAFKLRDLRMVFEQKKFELCSFLEEMRFHNTAYKVFLRSAFGKLAEDFRTGMSSKRESEEFVTEQVKDFNLASHNVLVFLDEMSQALTQFIGRSCGGDTQPQELYDRVAHDRKHLHEASLKGILHMVKMIAAFGLASTAKSAVAHAVEHFLESPAGEALGVGVDLSLSSNPEGMAEAFEGFGEIVVAETTATLKMVGPILASVFVLSWSSYVLFRSVEEMIHDINTHKTKENLAAHELNEALDELNHGFCHILASLRAEERQNPMQKLLQGMEMGNLSKDTDGLAIQTCVSEEPTSCYMLFQNNEFSKVYGNAPTWLEYAYKRGPITDIRVSWEPSMAAVLRHIGFQPIYTSLTANNKKRSRVFLWVRRGVGRNYIQDIKLCRGLCKHEGWDGFPVDTQSRDIENNVHVMFKKTKNVNHALFDVSVVSEKSEVPNEVECDKSGSTKSRHYCFAVSDEGLNLTPVREGKNLFDINGIPGMFNSIFQKGIFHNGAYVYLLTGRYDAREILEEGLGSEESPSSEYITIEQLKNLEGRVRPEIHNRVTPVVDMVFEPMSEGTYQRDLGRHREGYSRVSDSLTTWKKHRVPKSAGYVLMNTRFVTGDELDELKDFVCVRKPLTEEDLELAKKNYSSIVSAVCTEPKCCATLPSVAQEADVSPAESKERKPYLVFDRVPAETEEHLHELSKHGYVKDVLFLIEPKCVDISSDTCRGTTAESDELASQGWTMIDGGDFPRELPLREFGFDGAASATPVMDTLTLWVQQARAPSEHVTEANESFYKESQAAKRLCDERRPLAERCLFMNDSVEDMTVDPKSPDLQQQLDDAKRYEIMDLQGEKIVEYTNVEFTLMFASELAEGDLANVYIDELKTPPTARGGVQTGRSSLVQESEFVSDFQLVSHTNQIMLAPKLSVQPQVEKAERLKKFPFMAVKNAWQRPLTEISTKTQEATKAFRSGKYPIHEMWLVIGRKPTAVQCKAPIDKLDAFKEALYEEGFSQIYPVILTRATESQLGGWTCHWRILSVNVKRTKRLQLLRENWCPAESSSDSDSATGDSDNATGDSDNATGDSDSATGDSGSESGNWI